MKNLILINGLKRSGKDYSAELLREILGDIGVVSFAAPMKEIIADTFDISLEALDDFKNNDTELFLSKAELDGYSYNPLINFRVILQRFGTEAMKKQFGNDIWAVTGIKTAMEKENNWVIIPDFRFISEYEEAFKQSKDNNFKLNTIHIFNNDLPPADLHASERDLSDNNFIFDYEIDNTGKPDNIKEVLSNIIKDITSLED
jgi:hypothetical protein